ncbi:sulfatase-like hydrolase/transferase [Isosphaeraceae bacterium EP7]
MNHDPKRGTPHSRRLLVLALALVAGAATSRAGESVPEKARPNVLFLFSDDQRADTVAALGNAHIRTPNVDALVARGTSLNRAYCMGSPHGAVCAPSRAMLMSGRGLFHVKEDLDGQATWPQAFGKAGYSTFATGKWHNQAPSLLKSFQAGKALFLGGMGDPYHLPVQDISPEHTLVNKRFTGEHSVKVFADAASEFLAAQDGKVPFVCYVAFNFPHDPRVAPLAYRDRYDEATLPLPANYLPVHPFDNGDMAGRDERLAPWPRTPELIQHHLADYYASIEFVDAQVGRILGALKASGQLENTLIVYASDHGLAIGSHGLMGKQSLYDHSMHSPVILAGPGIPQGKRIDALTYLYDLFPTLGELAGVSGPEGSEGLSLVPVLEGREPTRRNSIFTAFAKVQRAVRDDRWKLIAYTQVNKSQLFDLQADPSELQDLSADPSHADDLARMTALLVDSQARAGDTLPLIVASPGPLMFDFDKARHAAPSKKGGH